MTGLIIDLPEIMPRHAALCGNKAVNLGVLARKSRTASGFCLITRAYEMALKQADIFQKIIELAEQVSLENMGEIEAVSHRIQTLIRNTPMPGEVEEAVRRAYGRLVEEKDGLKVAVRSSATVEDLSSASFAGQMESYLDLENWQQVKEAVINCWASLWSPRVLNYRLQQGINHHRMGIAVIIQEMIPAQVAGVMFTANPITNSREEIYIEAVAGSAELLAQGQVTGEVYTVGKEQNTVISRKIKGEYPLLTDFALRQLAHEGKKLEYVLDDCQDVEWAFYNGELFILQTRPITTLAAEETKFELPQKPTPVQKEIYNNVLERFPEPVLPLDTVVAKIYYLSLFSAYSELGYHVPVVDWRKVEQGIFPEGFTPPPIKSSVRRLFHLGKMLVGDLMKEWDYNEAVFNKYLDLMKQDLVRNFPMEIILEYLEDGLKDFQRANTFRYLLYIQYGNVYKLFRRLLKFFDKQKGEALFEDLVAGQPQITMEINRAMEEIADQIRENRETREFVLAHFGEEIMAGITRFPGGQEIQSLFDNFIARYGHREVSQGLSGIAALTWQDRPELVWGMIRGLVLRKDNSGLAAQTARRREAEEKLEALLSSGWRRLLPVRKVTERLLDYSRRYTAFRENSHSYLTSAMLVFRTLFLAIGRQLVEKGYLKQERDILYFTFWEVRDLVQDLYNLKEISPNRLEQKLAERKKDYGARKERWLKRDSVIEENTPGILQGVPAGRGQVTGTCRIIINPEELYRLEPGDILVTQSTNPSWTPVFSIIGGLVAEHGSALSHAAIIAREYGIPAVMGVKGATRVLTEGEQVTVDGSKGLVSSNNLVKGV